MSRTATVDELDRELALQSAVAQRAVATAQARATALEAELVPARDLIVQLRKELAATRAELQWLRRAGIDLNRVMAHPAARAARMLGRGARTALRVLQRS